MTDKPPTCEPGTSLGNRYRLVALVSRGDFTEIWRAQDEVLGRTVAAKILLPEHVANAAVKRLFMVEALAAARLTHANIVAVFDTGEHRGAPFIVMEYLAGGNLRHLMGSGPLHWDRAVQLGIQICAALSHAHSAGIIHRDLRPENVLFTEAGHLKVSDFGIAGAAMAARPTSAHSPRARDAYASPEQSIDLEPDMRADVYSVGAVLYECVVGKTPTEAVETPPGSAATSVRQIPRPSDLVPDVPGALDDALMTALAIDPAERFPTARALRQALKKLSPTAQADALPTTKARAAPRARPQSPPTEPSGAASPPGRAPQVSRPAEAPVAAPPRVQAEPVVDRASESFLRTEGRWLLPTLLVMVAAAAIVLAIPSVRDRLEDFVPMPGNRIETLPIAVEATGAYDPPPGDGEENSDTIGLAFDSDPATEWTTSSYATAKLGNLKPGVGIWFDLGEPAELAEINVSSVAGGWEGTIRHSDDGRNWSDPGSSREVRADHAFEVDGSHRYWMLWITRLVRTPGHGTGPHPFTVAIEEIEPVAAADS